MLSSLTTYSAILIDNDITTNYVNEILLVDSGRFIPSLIFSEATQAYEYIKRNYYLIEHASVARLFFIDSNMPGMDAAVELDWHSSKGSDKNARS